MRYHQQEKNRKENSIKSDVKVCMNSSRFRGGWNAERAEYIKPEYFPAITVNTSLIRSKNSTSFTRER